MWPQYSSSLLRDKLYVLTFFPWNPFTPKIWSSTRTHWHHNSLPPAGFEPFTTYVAHDIPIPSVDISSVFILWHLNMLAQSMKLIIILFVKSTCQDDVKSHWLGKKCVPFVDSYCCKLCEKYAMVMRDINRFTMYSETFIVVTIRYSSKVVKIHFQCKHDSLHCTRRKPHPPL